MPAGVCTTCICRQLLIVVSCDAQQYTTQRASILHARTDYIGGHAVKLIGWGSDNGTDYWIAANSWSPQWGIDGFFYILQGADECKIEQGVFVGEYGWHNGTTAPTSTGYASSTTGGSHNVGLMWRMAFGCTRVISKFLPLPYKKKKKN